MATVDQLKQSQAWIAHPERREQMLQVFQQAGAVEQDALLQIATGTQFPIAPDSPAPAPTPRTFKDIMAEHAGNVLGGAGKVVSGLPQLPGAVYRAGKELVTDPKQFVKDIPPFLEANIPMRESLSAATRAAASGDPRQLPPLKTVEDEAGQLGASLALGKAIPSIAKRAARRSIVELPGASVELHEQMAPRVRAVSEELRPPPGALPAAWAALKAEGSPNVTMTNFRTVVQDWLDKEHLKPTALRDTELARHLTEHLTDSQYGWGFDTVQAAQEAIGQIQRSFQATAGGRVGQTINAAPRGESRMYAQMMEAIDKDVQAMGTAHHPLWTEARRLYRRDRAASGLALDLEDAIGTGGDAWTNVGGLNRLITKIQKSRQNAARGNKAEAFWVKSFEPGELNRIVATLRDMKRSLPALSKGKGVITGSSQRLPQVAVGSAIGAGAGALFGHGSPMAAMIGAEAGSAAGYAVPQLIAKAMMSDAGRALVRRAMKIDPTVGPLFQQTLAGALRSQSSRADDTNP